MNEVPVIVISSPKSQSGKTTLAFNLAAALWSDGYHVNLFMPENLAADNFISHRLAFCMHQKISLPAPRSITKLGDVKGSADSKEVIIADIPTAKNDNYADIFSRAHTLITIADKPKDMQWKLNDSYLNLIWQAKKNIAARGIKYLNWIAVANLKNGQNWADSLEDAAHRYGFRIAPPLKNRLAYRHIDEGYCAADMTGNSKVFKMSLEDVYARREILKLTDFLWKQK
ncbi:MAG: hypothetical protein J6N49_03445 [Alphaproteobacteria bacterium]|nr:hypothetical protein [Alphaproteobacteria bacterium]